MFTGIIEEIGRLRSCSQRDKAVRLSVACRGVLTGSRIGDSIAVNGICLTAVAIGADHFTADVMPETWRRTGLRLLRAGSPVNLERALTPDGRLGGHLVSGHVDGTGTVIGRQAEANAIWLTIAPEPALMRYIVGQGSVALDGVSLTVAAVSGRYFQVSLIPHTAGRTTLGGRKPGDIVNVEGDPIAKHLASQLGSAAGSAGGRPASGRGTPDRQSSDSRLTLAWLAEQGFD